MLGFLIGLMALCTPAPQDEILFTGVPLGPTGSRVVQIGDVDEDGLLDMVVVEEIYEIVFPDHADVVFYRGHGDGGFDAPQLVTSHDDVIQGFRMADLDGDGHLDLALLGFGVLRGDGDGGFGPPTPFVGEPVGFGLGAVEANLLRLADLDGNGTLDAVAYQWQPPAIHSSYVIALGDGDGGFVEQASAVGQGVMERNFDVVDLDSDGAPDLVGVSAGDDVRVGLGDGVGGFGPMQSTGATGRPLFADLNEDGVLDAVTRPLTLAAPFSDNLFLSLGLGDGTFAAAVPASLSNEQPVAVVPHSLVSAEDVDGDGVIDLVVTTFGFGEACYARSGIGVYRGLGGLTWDRLLVTGVLPQLLAQGELGDLDDDGDLDAVVYGMPNLVALLAGPSRFVAWGDGHAPSGPPPTLRGAGTPSPGEAIRLTIHTEGPGLVGLLYAGLVAAPTPFAGGVLVPAGGLFCPAPPEVLITAPAELHDRWPSGLPPGQPVYVQAFLAAADGPSSTNALIIIGE